MDDLTTTLKRFAGGERSKAEAAETPFRQGLHEARANTMEQAAARIAALEAERDRLRDALADVVGALEAAGAELSEFANILSREPREANLAYQSARDAQDALARAALVKP